MCEVHLRIPKIGRMRNNKADSFYISAGSADAVRLAAKLLKDPVRPEETVPVIPESIGTILGRKGTGIRRICSLAGDQCYIVHKDTFSFKYVPGGYPKKQPPKIDISLNSIY